MHDWAVVAAWWTVLPATATATGWCLAMASSIGVANATIKWQQEQHN